MKNMKEWAARNVAWALPRRVAYWAFIRVAGWATTGPLRERISTDVTIGEVLAALGPGPDLPSRGAR